MDEKKFEAKMRPIPDTVAEAEPHLGETRRESPGMPDCPGHGSWCSLPSLSLNCASFAHGRGLDALSDFHACLGVQVLSRTAHTLIAAADSGATGG
ncbi:MAG: hypothetical protein AB7H03_12675 [Nitrospirales bacterium]